MAYVSDLCGAFGSGDMHGAMVFGAQLTSMDFGNVLHVWCGGNTLASAFVSYRVYGNLHFELEIVRMGNGGYTVVRK